ncbi:hypothetical protein HPB50_027365 [Hyalomma asiaticum]|uniref:Uncharacterized protein n=1 Tax=Hyalomma asiaticum TaxID=266040 RepID=A0ACB7TAC9_HYAAI|nr:hypothetical protein HPB50_027365 [Hyalomma asiaticum]
MVSLHKPAKALAKCQANGIPPGQRPATKQQQDANNNGAGGKTAVDWFAPLSGDRSTRKPQLTTASAVVSARPPPELARSKKPPSKAPPKMVLDEDFPTLATRSIARISISSSPTPRPQSEPPWNTGKSAKTKKKKKTEETKQTEPSKHPPGIEINNNGTAKVPSAVTSKQPSETSTESTPSVVSPTNNLLQLIAAARKGTTMQAPPPEPTTEVVVSDGDTSDSDERPKRLTVADFPCLNGRPSGTAAPPPGFGKPKPPPGFARPPMCDTTMGTLSSLVAATTPPSPAVPPQYTPPAGFQQRNLGLIQDVQQILAKRSEDGLFATFKSLSGSFRQGVLSADEYFTRCIELFGSEKEFITIFPELLFLLPDIRKQQELMATYNAHRKAQAATSGALPKGSPVQLLVCATCQQVLSAEDFRSHRTMHDPS